MNVVFSQRAIEDIDLIYLAIAAANPRAAQQVEDMIRVTCERLTDFPFASAATDEPGVRRIPLVRYPYTIFFRVNEAHGVIEIARVLHAARVKSLTQLPE